MIIIIIQGILLSYPLVWHSITIIVDPNSLIIDLDVVLI